MKGTGHCIRRYVPGDEVAIVDLFNLVFGAHDPAFVPRTVDWWRWKYPANPAGFHALLVEDPDGRIIGHYGGVPMRFVADGDVVQFGQNSDALSDPRVRSGLRNPGLFVRLAQGFASTYGIPGADAVMYGLPVPEHYRIGVRYLDYWMLRTQMALVLRTPARLPDWAYEVNLAPCTRFGAEADAFAHAMRSVYRGAALRDAAFLNWRFCARPDQSYRVARAKTGDRDDHRGHVVYRKGPFAGKTVGLIMDWFADPDDGRAAQSLIRWVAERGVQDGLDELVFLCPTSSVWFQKFQDFGFEAETSPYVMTARPYASRFEPSWLREHWYYTLADFDLL